MFDYRRFLMTGFRDAVGKQADYMVIQNANGYYEKAVLTEEDLAELQRLIDEKNTIDLPEIESESSVPTTEEYTEEE